MLIRNASIGLCSPPLQCPQTILSHARFRTHIGGYSGARQTAPHSTTGGVLAGEVIADCNNHRDQRESSQNRTEAIVPAGTGYRSVRRSGTPVNISDLTDTSPIGSRRPAMRNAP